MGTQGFVMGDDDDYYRLAISLMQSGQLSDHGILAYRMPFFPIVLAGIFSLFGPYPQSASIIMVVLSSFTCGLIFLLANEIFSSSVAIIAAILSIIDIALIYYSQFLLTETLVVFLLVSGFYAFERLNKSGHWHWAVISGALFGLATMTRVQIGLFVPILLGWMAIRTHLNFQLVLPHIAIIAGFVIILWGAWIVRNYLELGAFVPLTTQGGNGYYGIYNDISTNPPNNLLYGFWFNFPLPSETVNLSEVELDHWQRQFVFEWIRIHPVEAVKIALIQAFHLWQPDFISPAKLVAIHYLTIFVWGIVGCIRTIRRKIFQVIPWILFAVSLTFASVISIGVPRFSLPMHPFLAILSAFAFKVTYSKIHPNNRLSRSITPFKAG